MGKVFVTGSAERQYAPDRADIFVGVEAVEKTADKASGKCSRQCEQLLAELKKIGIEPENVEVHCDNIDKYNAYEPEKAVFFAKKDLRIRTDASQSVITSIKQIIEGGYENISFDVQYSVSNEEKLKEQLLKDAIADSRRKAEFLAESMNLRITGIDSANLSDTSDLYDITDIMEEDGVFYKSYSRVGDVGRLEDLLQPEKITLSTQIKIIWLLDE